MAKLSQILYTQRRRPPRRSIYEVATTGESEDSEDDNSPSEQLLREADQSLPPPSSSAPSNVTPDRPVPTDNLTSSRKSVRFVDATVTESAHLLSLAAAKKRRGGPKGKLVRPSSFPAPVGLKKPPPQPVKDTRRSERVQEETENTWPKISALRPNSGEVQTSSSSTKDSGEQRSGRSRQNGATSSDTDITGAAAGQAADADSRQTPHGPSNYLPPENDERITRKVWQTWSKDEKAKLRKACKAEESWEEIQKILPHRTLSAIQSYAVKHDFHMRAYLKHSIRSRNGIDTRAEAAKAKQQTAEIDPEGGVRKNNSWTEEELALLTKLHSQGMSWKDMAKLLPGRTKSAIETRCSMLKLNKVKNKHVEGSNHRKRKQTVNAQSLAGPVKRRRVAELPASNPTTSPASQSDVVTSAGPVQRIQHHTLNQPASSSPSTAKRVEVALEKNETWQPIHQEEFPLLVEAENRKQTSRLVRPAQDEVVGQEEEEEEEDQQEEEEAEEEHEEEEEEVGAENQDDGYERDTTETQAHASVQKTDESDGDYPQACESDDVAHQMDRNDDALDLDDDDPDAPPTARLFHQFARLKEIVASVKKLQARVDELDIRRPPEAPFEDFDSLRRKILESYEALLGPATEQDAIYQTETISRDITNLGCLVDELDPKAANDEELQQFRTNIFAFIFPDLLKVMATASYHLVKRTRSDDDVRPSDLSVLIDIIRCITNLNSRASKWKTEARSSLALAGHVKNDIVAPLKKILKEFASRRDRLEAEEEEIQRKRRQTLEVKRLRAEREMKKKRLAEWTSKGDRLRVLYMWRASVETDLDRRLEKLAMPNLRQREQLYPLDANGEPFERETVFRPRSSIPHMDRPSAADEDEDWTEEELEALQEGLAEIAHDEFFWRNFYKEYCHHRTNYDGTRGGPLRDRSVAEILKEMVRFRAYSIEDEEELPEWLLDIPDMDLVPLL